jgi:hypothetical protein
MVRKHFRNRVEPTRTQWLAAGETAEGEEGAAPSAKPLDRERGVFRATRVESAASAK